MPKLTAFVARSFDPADNFKIDPIIKFLDSFRAAGFIHETAERAQVESVSEQVRKMIDSSEVFVGIFTKRHPVYTVPTGFKGALDVLLKRITPQTWTAPPWVLQECGYALRGERHLVLFREINVEIPGLQGDLEYIPFDPNNPHSAFLKASEMINGLMGSAAGIVVSTTVAAADGKQTEAAPITVEPEQRPPEDDERQHFAAMMGAIAEDNWEAAEKAYTNGLDFIRKNEPGDEVFWKTIYHRERFKAGKTSALDDLRVLASLFPEDPLPTAYVGACLSDFGQYTEAVDHFEKAANTSKGDAAVQYMLRAAHCIRLAGRPGECRKRLNVLWQQVRDSETKVKFHILRELYSSLAEANDGFSAFAIGELALHEDPTQGGFRFSLGFDYGKAKYAELNLYHYKILCERDPRNSGAFNNLGVAYQEIGCPIESVAHYRKALELGDTLAASNLGYLYLGAGMADDARSLLQKALEKGGYVDEVPKCMAAIGETAKQEEENTKEKIKIAKEQEEFLISFGCAYLEAEVPSLSGTWEFPFGEIPLELEAGELLGKAVIEIPATLGLLAHSSSPEAENLKREKIRFSGKMLGRGCKYRISIERILEPSEAWMGSLLSGHREKKEGYIAFASDGTSGSVVELKEEKPQEHYQIRKVG